jgi:uncharacterized membrane protein YhaH (DUF805 family)
MSAPATNPDDKPRPPGKARFSIGNPFANTTRQDVKRGLSGSFSLLAFIFWPLGLLYFLLMLPVRLWQLRHWFFPFRLRAGRRWFWNAIVIYLSVGGLLAAVIGNGIDNRLVADSLLTLLGLVIGSSAVAIGIARLNDRDISGWWIVLYYGIPAAIVAGLVVAQPPIGAMGVGEVFTFYFLIWALIALGFRRGTPGPNRFGPEILRPASAPKRPA